MAPPIKQDVRDAIAALIVSGIENGVSAADIREATDQIIDTFVFNGQNPAIQIDVVDGISPDIAHSFKLGDRLLNKVSVFGEFDIVFQGQITNFVLNEGWELLVDGEQILYIDTTGFSGNVNDFIGTFLPAQLSPTAWSISNVGAGTFNLTVGNASVPTGTPVKFGPVDGSMSQQNVNPLTVISSGTLVAKTGFIRNDGSVMSLSYESGAGATNGIASTADGVVAAGRKIIFVTDGNADDPFEQPVAGSLEWSIDSGNNKNLKLVTTDNNHGILWQYGVTMEMRVADSPVYQYDPGGTKIGNTNQGHLMFGNMSGPQSFVVTDLDGFTPIFKVTPTEQRAYTPAVFQEAVTLYGPVQFFAGYKAFYSVYADNTAALAGGLTSGEHYRTADGTVKVVF